MKLAFNIINTFDYGAMLTRGVKQYNVNVVNHASVARNFYEKKFRSGLSTVDFDKTVHISVSNSAEWRTGMDLDLRMCSC